MHTNSPKFFGAHQDDSHKVENDQSVKDQFWWFLRRDELKLQVLKWLDSNGACVMFSMEY